MTQDKLPKCCVLCQHFDFDQGHPDYSELTPGDPARIQCKKGHFWESLNNITEDEYRNTMLKAETCPDFQTTDFIVERNKK